MDAFPSLPTHSLLNEHSVSSSMDTNSTCIQHNNAEIINMNNINQDVTFHIKPQKRPYADVGVDIDQDASETPSEQNGDVNNYQDQHTEPLCSTPLAVKSNVMQTLPQQASSALLSHDPINPQDEVYVARQNEQYSVDHTVNPMVQLGKLGNDEHHHPKVSPPHGPQFDDIVTKTTPPLPNSATGYEWQRSSVSRTVSITVGKDRRIPSSPPKIPCSSSTPPINDPLFETRPPFSPGASSSLRWVPLKGGANANGPNGTNACVNGTQSSPTNTMTPVRALSTLPLSSSLLPSTSSILSSTSSLLPSTSSILHSTPLISSPQSSSPFNLTPLAQLTTSLQLSSKFTASLQQRLDAIKAEQTDQSLQLSSPKLIVSEQSSQKSSQSSSLQEESQSATKEAVGTKSSKKQDETPKSTKKLRKGSKSTKKANKEGSSDATTDPSGDNQDSDSEEEEEEEEDGEIIINPKIDLSNDTEDTILGELVVSKEDLVKFKDVLNTLQLPDDRVPPLIRQIYKVQKVNPIIARYLLPPIFTSRANLLIVPIGDLDPSLVEYLFPKRTRGRIYYCLSCQVPVSYLDQHHLQHVAYITNPASTASERRVTRCDQCRIETGGGGGAARRQHSNSFAHRLLLSRHDDIETFDFEEPEEIIEYYEKMALLNAMALELTTNPNRFRPTGGVVAIRHLDPEQLDLLNPLRPPSHNYCCTYPGCFSTLRSKGSHYQRHLEYEHNDPNTAEARNVFRCHICQSETLGTNVAQHYSTYTHQYLSAKAQGIPFDGGKLVVSNSNEDLIIDFPDDYVHEGSGPPRKMTRAMARAMAHGKPIIPPKVVEPPPPKPRRGGGRKAKKVVEKIEEAKSDIIDIITPNALQTPILPNGTITPPSGHESTPTTATVTVDTPAPSFGVGDYVELSAVSKEATFQVSQLLQQASSNILTNSLTPPTLITPALTAPSSHIGGDQYSGHAKDKSVHTPSTSNSAIPAPTAKRTTSKKAATAKATAASRVAATTQMGTSLVAQQTALSPQLASGSLSTSNTQSNSSAPVKSTISTAPQPQSTPYGMNGQNLNDGIAKNNHYSHPLNSTQMQNNRLLPVQGQNSSLLPGQTPNMLPGQSQTPNMSLSGQIQTGNNVNLQQGQGQSINSLLPRQLSSLNSMNTMSFPGQNSTTGLNSMINSAAISQNTSLVNQNNISQQKVNQNTVNPQTNQNMAQQNTVKQNMFHQNDSTPSMMNPNQHYQTTMHPTPPTVTFTSPPPSLSSSSSSSHITTASLQDQINGLSSVLSPRGVGYSERVQPLGTGSSSVCFTTNSITMPNITMPAGSYQNNPMSPLQQSGTSLLARGFPDMLRGTANHPLGNAVMQKGGDSTGHGTATIANVLVSSVNNTPGTNYNDNQHHVKKFADVNNNLHNESFSPQPIRSGFLNPFLTSTSTSVDTVSQLKTNPNIPTMNSHAFNQPGHRQVEDFHQQRLHLQLNALGFQQANKGNFFGTRLVAPQTLNPPHNQGHPGATMPNGTPYQLL